MGGSWPVNSARAAPISPAGTILISVHTFIYIYWALVKLASMSRHKAVSFKCIAMSSSKSMFKTECLCHDIYLDQKGYLSH